ncbi:MAG: AAA family ATPase [Eubacterium sp.]
MNIVKATELQTKEITALIYAAPGMGKTTALGYLPGKTLILDIDHSSDVLAGNENIDIVYIDNNLMNFNPVLQELEGGHTYDNICVDNLSELEKCMLTEYGKQGKNDGAPELIHYNRTNFKIVDYVRRFRALPGNTVFTAWEEMSEITYPSGEKYTRFVPMLGKKTKDGVCGLCNMVAHLEYGKESSQTAYAKDQVYKRKYCEIGGLISG